MYTDRLDLKPNERIVIHKGPLGNGMWYANKSNANARWCMVYDGAERFKTVDGVIQALLALAHDPGTEKGLHTNSDNKITLYIVAQTKWEIVGRFGTLQPNKE